MRSIDMQKLTVEQKIGMLFVVRSDVLTGDLEAKGCFPYN